MSLARFLPYGRQTIEDDDVAAVVTALRSDYLTTGPLVEAFERNLAAAAGARCAVVCNSGTAALHLAVLALNVGPRQAAVVPTLTFLSTANVVRMTGAEVVFCDVDAESGLMTDETFAAACAQAKVRSIEVAAAIPVHFGGQLCDMRALAAVADEHNTALVEDACHALGIEGAGATVHSRIACFSTHPVKAIATGEGGFATTADNALAGRMRVLRNHGMTRAPDKFKNLALAFDNGSQSQANPWYYEMSEIGWNYRLPDVLCALGMSQLTKLARFHRRRVEIAAQYDRLLAPLAPVLRPVRHGNRPHGWHLYSIHVDFASLGITRARFMAALRAENIGTQVHYIPVHLQPYYRRRYGELRLPGAEAYYASCLSIPIFPSMSDEDIARVADVLAKLVGAD